MNTPLSDEQRQALIGLLGEGLSTEEISLRTGIPKMQIAGVKAHLTMGTYGHTVVTLDSEELGEVQHAAALKFGLERDMQEAIRGHIEQLDPTLRIIDGGKERHVESGFIDILAEDEGGSLVVIELKAGLAPDDVITQVLAYIGALGDEEPERRLRGLVIAREFSARVRHAARAAGIELYTYGYSFTFERHGTTPDS